MSLEKVKFFVDHNKNENGEHLVHRLTCPVLPSSRDREYLGKYREVAAALNHAIKSDFSPALPCKSCCPEYFSEDKG